MLHACCLYIQVVSNSIALYPNHHELVNHVLQTLLYACQRMADDKLLRDYHVPPVSSPHTLKLACHDTRRACVLLLVTHTNFLTRQTVFHVCVQYHDV